MVFGKTAKHRPAVAPVRRECGRHSARPVLDFEPFFAKHVDESRCGLVFAPGRLRVVPNLEMEIRKSRPVGVDPVYRKELLFRYIAHVRLRWLQCVLAWRVLPNACYAAS